MPVSLASHIASVAKYLAAVPHAQRKLAAKSQHEVLLTLASKASKRSADDWTDACGALTHLSSCMSEEQVSELSSAFNEQMGLALGNADGKDRRSQQDWTRCWTRLPKQMVECISAFKAQVGLEKLLAWLHARGLRLPSEPTYGSITAVYLTLFEDGGNDQEAAQKLLTLQHVKECWDRLDKTAPVQHWWPTWDGQGIVPEAERMWEVDPISMQALIKSIPLRTTHTGAKRRAAPTVQLHGSESMGSADAGMRFAAGLMQQMQQVQADC